MTYCHILLFHILTRRDNLNLIKQIFVKTNFQQAVGFFFFGCGDVYEDDTNRLRFIDDRSQVDQGVVELEEREVFEEL